MEDLNLLTESSALQSEPVECWQSGNVSLLEDRVAVEAPVALTYNGISYAVMMATPQDLEDFALGFSLTEGVLENPSDMYDIAIQQHSLGFDALMEISARRKAALADRRRTLAGKTGCGLCGVESLHHAVRDIPAIGIRPKISNTAIQSALNQLPDWQPMRAASGACHGAAWASLDGEILLAREDVGRHNALDKLIGALVKAKWPRDKGFIVVSSRASFEMVQKVACVGIGTLVAVSAPTTLALETAQKTGVNLIAFGRPGRHVRYRV